MNDRLPKYLAGIRRPFAKFAVVGAAGIIVNEGMLALLVDALHLRLELAGAIAIECAILFNFLLNYWWTWRIRDHRRFFVRALQYHSVALVAGLINYAILLALTHAGMHHLLANLIGIAAGTAINFFFNHHWTFKQSLEL